jgi:hypothetical protein
MEPKYIYIAALLIGLLLGSLIQLLRGFHRAEREPSGLATCIGSFSVILLVMLFKYVAYRQRHPDASFWTFFF